MKHKKWMLILMSAILALSLFGCSTTAGQTDSSTTTVQASSVATTTVTQTSSTSSSTSTAVSTSTSYSGLVDTSDMFTDRDLEQSADLTDAVYYTLEDGQDITITEEGVYVLSGEASNVTVKVDVDDESKVQIVLDGVTITNESAPAIYVLSGDKVFVTTTDSENSLSVTGTFVADGDTNLDAVIFSKSDLVLNGLGTLTITSAEGNGITSKDDLKVTGGTYSITSLKDALEANDSIRIYAGDITIVTDKDGLHSENDDDDSLGYIYIQGGTLNITAGDDGIQGNAFVQIDGGTISIPQSTEGIEGTYVQINGGSIDIYATDDGINASDKSTSYDIVIEVNGGTINVVVGSGDTDGFDANGDIYINGGTISVEANSAFDADGVAELNGGTVTVNGTVITEITETQMGPGGGHGGAPGGGAPSGGPGK